MVLKLIRSMLRDELAGMISEKLHEVLRLDPKSQYIIVVSDDQTAKDLHEELVNHFDLSNGPRLIVLSAKNVNLIEITREG